MKRIDDDWLYAPETVFDQSIIFGDKLCPVCGLTLAACSDYFTTGTNADGLASGCRRCRRERGRSSKHHRRAAVTP